MTAPFQFYRTAPRLRSILKGYRRGPFTVTPILTDHSAFDAYVLLIEDAGKSIFYTGYFGRHGRKSACVDRAMAKPRRISTYSCARV